LASGLLGIGRLLETPELLGHITSALGRDGDLAGRTVVVSAGGTQEPIDPVRVITNNSSGKMGYALAEAARDRGAKAILITAPTSLPDPPLVKVIQIQTAQQMCDAVLNQLEGADALIMAAAVADYRPVTVAEQKNQEVTARADHRPYQDHRHPGGVDRQIRQGGILRGEREPDR